MKMKKESYVEIQKRLNRELREINEKISLKNKEVINSEEYKLLNKLGKELYHKINKLDEERKALEKPIYKKYVNIVYSDWNGKYKVDKINHYVKKGIARGLGILNMVHINKEGYRNVIKQLIKNDLSKLKGEIERLEKDRKNFDLELKKNYEQVTKMQEEATKHLVDKRLKICSKLNKKEKDREERIEKNQREAKIRINKHLPHYMDKIINEVDKQLILEKISN